MATLHGDVGILGDLFQTSLKLLQSLTTSHAQVGIDAAQKRSLKRVSQLLFLCGDDHDVSVGGLDVKLQGSPHILQLVVRILRRMLNLVIKGIVDFPRVPMCISSTG